MIISGQTEKNMTLIKEQKAIVETEKCILVVSAFAGVGKTSTQLVFTGGIRQKERVIA